MNNVMRTALITDLQKVIDNYKVYIDKPLSEAKHRLESDLVDSTNPTTRLYYRVIRAALDDMDGLIMKCRRVLDDLNIHTEDKP